MFTASGKLRIILTTVQSMCVPKVTQHASIRCSIFCHSHVNMCASIFFTAAKFRAFRLARSRGNFETIIYTWNYSNSKKNKTGRNLKGFGGNTFRVWLFPEARLIQIPNNTVFRNWRTSEWKWAGLTVGKSYRLVHSTCTGFENTFATDFKK
jgi:hypothetical protein